MRCWAMRGDRNRRLELSEELRAGRLRQGWGWDDKLDLRRLKVRADADQLEGWERDVWKRTWRVLVGEPGGFSVGDVVVVPGILDSDAWAIVRVTGDYSFQPLDLPDGRPDYGHVVPVEIIQARVAPRNADVGAGLRKSFKCRRRLWNLDDYCEEIETLIASVDPDAVADDRQLLEALRLESEAHLLAGLEQRYGDADFERPLGRLLRALYGEGATVDPTGGRSEHGADLVCRYQDALGTDHAVAAQVKMWTGSANEGSLLAAVSQVTRAYDWYEGITSTVVLTLLETIPSVVEQHCDERSRDLGVPVRVMGRDEVVPLLLKHLGEVAADEA